MKKNYLFIFFILVNFSCYAQSKSVDDSLLTTVDTVTVSRCKLDTIKGLILYEKNGEQADIGYYVAYCGGMQIGPYSTDTSFQQIAHNPTNECYDIFIPSEFINNYYDTKGKEHWSRYIPDSGTFYDYNWKKMDKRHIYGMLIKVKNKK
jgi:hypothetical protein